MSNDESEPLGFARTFEELWIWQHARWAVRDVYRDFGLGTESERDFGFRGQIQRAAVSIMNNIAEGFERKSAVEFQRFLDIAKGSCGEVRSMYYTAEDLGYVSSNIATERRRRCLQISGGIASLISRIKKRREETGAPMPNRASHAIES